MKKPKKIQWKEDIEKENKSLENNDTWLLVDKEKTKRKRLTG